mmetsp:Transcript_47907/g.113849  ORF Transcript_47907/g.113849 Transcript_47907/m.113849 type:complete len:207 (+) Transcript_47907:485-1105(+)
MAYILRSLSIYTPCARSRMQCWRGHCHEAARLSGAAIVRVLPELRRGHDFACHLATRSVGCLCVHTAVHPRLLCCGADCQATSAGFCFVGEPTDVGVAAPGVLSDARCTRTFPLQHGAAQRGQSHGVLARGSGDACCRRATCHDMLLGSSISLCPRIRHSWTHLAYRSGLLVWLGPTCSSGDWPEDSGRGCSQAQPFQGAAIPTHQ